MLKAKDTGTNIECFNIAGEKVNDAGVMADKLNDYFVGVGQTLAAKISLSTHSFREYLNPPPLNSFSILGK